MCAYMCVCREGEGLTDSAAASCSSTARAHESVAMAGPGRAASTAMAPGAGRAHARCCSGSGWGRRHRHYSSGAVKFRPAPDGGGGWLGGSTGLGSGRAPTPRVWGPVLMYYRRVSPVQ